MIKKFLTLFLLLATISVSAQYTEVINSNRPGLSESPYSVGTGVYQFETSFFHRKADAIPTFSNPQATGLNIHFRTGLLDEKFEVSLTTAIQQDKNAFLNIYESTTNQFGFGQFTLAAKYLVFVPKYNDRSKEIRSWNKRHKFDFKRWIPHVSVYAGVNIGSFLNDYHQRGGITPKLGVLLQNEFSDRLNVITNIYYNYMGGYLPEWSYIISGTYNFNKKWSGFAEHQALFNKQETQSNLGLGVAYLFNKNIQINSALRSTFQEESIGYHGSIGVSYRIDRHVDKFVELDEFGNKIEEEKTQTYNKGFFGRMLDKIKGIFKKKDKIDPEIEEGNDINDEDINDDPRGRKRPKSILDDLTKKDEKEKKQTTKADKKAAKKKKKEEEKALKKLEKEKLKEEKRKEKERLKLEKEIKKMEEELKKEEEKAKEEELQRQYEEEKKKRAAKKKEDE
ncbi:transporter [Tenacibaculum geojense]|uniref:Transporter n=1 Tax=Tenacibaculum geojense TaxID=915352 RepID=A0ABW3JQL4_9FLAO